MLSAGANNIERMCRTCLYMGDVRSTSIYEVEARSNCPLRLMLKETAPALISQLEDDGLPQILCVCCVEKLTNAYEFQALCYSSDAHLRNLVECSRLEMKFEVLAATEAGTINTAAAEQEDDPLDADEKCGADNNDSAYSAADFGKVEAMEIPTSLLDAATGGEYKEESADSEIYANGTTPSRLAGDSEGAKEDDGPVADDGDGDHHRLCEIPANSIRAKKKRAAGDVLPALVERQLAVPLRKKQRNGGDGGAVCKEHRCELCAKTFQKAYGLLRHRAVHERQKTPKDHKNAKLAKSYVCDYCNKAFQQSCTLKDHIRTHTGEQPYLCCECGRAFNSASNMKQHLLRHTGLKRYECPDCPKKFPCPSDLASHRAVHSRVKPHGCEICGAAFGKPFQLKKHKMYHNGDKPHKCEYCERRFVCADHMRRHARTHTGEKPYKCEYCARAFAQSNDLIKHLRTHLGDQVYRCELCPQAYRLAAELRNHLVVHKHESDATRQRNLLDLQAKLRELRAARQPLLASVPAPQTNKPDLCLS